MGRLWTFGKRLNTELTDGRIRDNTDGKRCGLNISYKKLSNGPVEGTIKLNKKESHSKQHISIFSA